MQNCIDQLKSGDIIECISSSQKKLSFVFRRIIHMLFSKPMIVVSPTDHSTVEMILNLEICTISKIIKK